MSAPLELGICVHDLDQMVAFYVGALECEEKARSRVPGAVTGPLGQGPDGFDVVWLQTPWGERIKLIHPLGTLESAGPPPHLSARPGIAYLTFYVPDINERAAKLLEHGARVLTDPAPFTPVPGVQIIFFADPEGNAVELVERADVLAYRPDLASRAG